MAPLEVSGRHNPSIVQLILTADDYGYSRRYDEGILTAARAGALDAVSAFATREALGPEPLLATGVEVGLHLDLGAPATAARADEVTRERAEGAAREQLRRFAERFGREPAYLDGHHHCHARGGLGVMISDLATEHDLPVRSVDARHRRLLSCRGVRTPDLLVGRLVEGEPVVPAELASDALPEVAVIEWMVHPGYADAAAGSDYDAGREEDLAILLEWTPPEKLRRASHGAALDGG